MVSNPYLLVNSKNCLLLIILVMFNSSKNHPHWDSLYIKLLNFKYLNHNSNILFDLENKF